MMHTLLKDYDLCVTEVVVTRSDLPSQNRLPQEATQLVIPHIGTGCAGVCRWGTNNVINCSSA